MVRLSLPNWVEHPIIDDKKRKRQTIFSLHVHPDGSRLATGGLDQKIRIWSTEPIVDEELEKRKDVHKLLCAMSRHTGSVLVVRWSPSGRFLASGSDDTICLIWEMDFSGMGGGSFGSFGSREDEPTVESWRPHRRLVGHESDVVDLAWSPDEDDSYLATVGLDSRVIVWSGPRKGQGSFERLRVINGHQGFVKGVVWDPIGQYLATMSDDKSVKFWRIGGDWGLVKTITKPFQTSRSTFFRRSSWSPDGQHILCANAMSGSIFVANVIKRDDWSSDINLVGHENAVAVTSFCPRLVYDNDEEEQDDKQSEQEPIFSTIMALGSLDQSISIWIAGHRRPLAVLRDIFQLQIMDLSWSKDGRTLFACSADGYIASFSFNEEDIKFAPDAELLKARELLSFTEHQRAFRQSKSDAAFTNGSLNGGLQPGTSQKPNMLVPRKAGVPRAPLSSAVPAPASSQTQRLNQHITLTRDGKRRIRPTLIEGDESRANSYDDHIVGAPNTQATVYSISADSDYIASRAIEPTTPLQRDGKRSISMAYEAGEEDVPLPSGKKIKDVGRTLGGEVRRGQSGPSVALSRRDGSAQMSAVAYGVPGLASVLLTAPQAMSVYKREDNAGTIEIRNFDESGRATEIYHFEAGNTSRCTWMDFSPSRGITATLSETFSAVAFEDGTVGIYSAKGRRLSTMQLDALTFKMECCLDYLAVLTVDGQMRRWNVRRDAELGRTLSFLSLFATQGLGAMDYDEILHFWIHSNGLPVIIMRSERAFTLDTDKMTWALVSCGWFADCSPKWEGRSRGRGASMDSMNGAGISAIRREPIRSIESTINDLVVIHRPTSGIQPAVNKPSDADKQAEFDVAITLRHMEARLSASVMLDSAKEYTQHLMTYARTLGDEGIRNQAEDLCRSLMGPVYYMPTSHSGGSGGAMSWSPTVCGVEKRTLLGEVLRVMARGRLLLGLVDTYQKLLKDVQQQQEY